MKKMKALVVAAAALSLSALLLAGCSGGTAADDKKADDKAPAQEEKTTLIVGLDNAYPPYGFVGDDGNLTGFDIDLATEVANRNDWSIELMPIDWDAKDALLGQGTVNCIWNGFTMEGREDNYTFSEPYMLNEQVIVTKAGAGIDSLEGLAGKVVITQIDSAALDVLEGDQAELAATFGKLDTISDYNNAFMQLEAGTVDAVACDLSIAAYQMAANPDAYVQLETPLSSEHYAVGFKKGDESLVGAVNETLKAMYADGTVQQLCEKYGQYGLSFDNWVLK